MNFFVTLAVWRAASDPQRVSGLAQEAGKACTSAGPLLERFRIKFIGRATLRPASDGDE